MTDLINILLPPAKIHMKIGLFFGSFNPVHIGHMAIANYVVEFTGIDQLWFVVSPQNPLKEEADLLNGFDRIEMMQRAVVSDHRFRVSDVEFHLPKPSYTIDTLTGLTGKYPAHRFILLIGSDNLAIFRQWKNFETILDNYEIMIYPRPGSDQEEFPVHKNIRLIKAPLMDISSTFIRQSIREGKNMRYFVPSGVWEYIDEMQFYRK